MSTTGACLGQFSCRGGVEFVVQDAAALEREAVDSESQGERWLRDKPGGSGDAVLHVATTGGYVRAGGDLCRGRRSSHNQSRETRPGMSHGV